MNKVILIGNLVKDPEIQTTASGVSVCKFSVAINRPYKKDGETETDFFNIVAWRGVADNVGKYLKKGNKCAVTGAMQNHSYDAQDGTKRYITEVIADSVEFLTAVKKDETKTESAPVDDSVPF
jgi:single-strand DNA-binding protein